MHPNSETCVADPDCAPHECDAAKRKERFPSQFESLCPLRATCTQSNPRVEKLDVSLVEARLLQTCDLGRVLTKRGRKLSAPRTASTNKA